MAKWTGRHREVKEHDYLYTLRLRVKGEWQAEYVQIEACNLEQAQYKAELLHKVKSDDCGYITKQIIK